MKSRNHDRAPGMVQTSIALPQALLDRLTTLAARDRRTRNNLIALLLEHCVGLYEERTRKMAELAGVDPATLMPCAPVSTQAKGKRR